MAVTPEQLESLKNMMEAQQKQIWEIKEAAETVWVCGQQRELDCGQRCEFEFVDNDVNYELVDNKVNYEYVDNNMSLRTTTWVWV